MTDISSLIGRPAQGPGAPAMTTAGSPIATASRPSISIAMATYNGAAYLAAQLDSLAAQSFAPAELVVTDDGSSDATEQLVANFASMARFPVRWHRNASRLGYKGNFVLAASLCTSDIIAFCDQDDIWHANKLERLAALFETQPDALLVYHNARIFSHSGDRDELFYTTPPGPRLAPPMSVRPWHFSHGFTQAMRRSLLPAAQFWPQSLDMYHRDDRSGHDVFFFQIASACGNIAYIQEPLADYRQHAANVTGVGAMTPPSGLERWRQRLQARAETYAYLARVAAANAAILAGFARAAALPAAFQPRAQLASQRWGDLAKLYDLRRRVCSDATIARRIGAFAGLLRYGAYGRGNTWSFGFRAWAKDFVLGVLFGPLVQRYGYPSSNGDPACRINVSERSARR